MMAIQNKLVVGALVLFSSLGAGLLLWGLLWGLSRWPVAAQPPGASLAAVWANEGGDKVTRDELRATSDPSAVHNSVWDGTTVTLFGARNEVLGFNLVLEAPTHSTGPLQVSLTHLDGAAATITTTQATSPTLFNYLGRSIELFFVRYLEIEGISRLAYEDYDERHVPERCRRPYTDEGNGNGLWTDRPCHNKLYPEIAVPLALQSPFTIPAGTNQSIWVDIYIPKSTPAGVYSGTLEIREAGIRVRAVPVRLSVLHFTLPDLPSARTMLFFSQEEINHRYLGAEHRWPAAGTAVYTQGLALADRHVQLAHRHKISLIEGSTPLEQMGDGWVKRLSGELFTPAYGYDGVGGGVGNAVYSIGTYGQWPWQGEGQEELWRNSDAWVDWFEGQNFATPVEYFLYLVDESDDFPQTELWARWLDDNPGSGRRLKALATLPLPDATAHTPSLEIPASAATIGERATWEAALASLRADPAKRFFLYNGHRPATGSFAIEDDGVALRQLGWTQFKQGIDRWFKWESTYYTNFQCYGYDDPAGWTNLFRQAQTFGCYTYDDPVRGKSGWNYNNGDGVLFYPGTESVYPAESYGVAGPLASLRLKQWRRGIQDVDYLTLAAAVDPAAVQQIVARLVPTVTWEYGVSDPADPTWVRTDISWPTDPDLWEAARWALAQILERPRTLPPPIYLPTVLAHPG